MPSSCAVGCSNRKNTDNDLIFYTIPGGKHPFQQNRRKLWLQAIKRENWSEKQIKNARLCSAHFISGEWVRINYHADLNNEKTTHTLILLVLKCNMSLENHNQCFTYILHYHFGKS